MRSVVVGFATAVTVALGVPTCAQAAWSSARTFEASGVGSRVLAINGRGDAVVLWTTSSPARMRITLLPSRGRTTTRLLSRRPGGALKVVLDERGGATVAWTVDGRLYATHGSVFGRWSTPQLVAGRFASGPEMAVSRDRTVVLVWTNESATGPGSTGVAWRTPRHAFFGQQRLSRPAPGLMPGEAPQSDNGATFDAAGRAYVWGTCDGVVRVTRPYSRRFKLLRVAPDRALRFSLSVTEAGRGLASWVDSRCTTDPAAGAAPGPVRVRALRAGTFGPPVTLTTGAPQTTALSGLDTHAIALAGDGNLVIVGTELSMHPLAVTLDAHGALGSMTAITDRRIPFAADAVGNLILSAPYVGVIVRPHGGADEPFDKGGTDPNPPSIGASPAVASNGRGFGVVWDPDLTFGPDSRAVTPRRRLSVSLWSPTRR